MSKPPLPRWLHRHSAVLIFSGVVAVSGGLSNTWLSRLELRFAGVVQENRGVRQVPDRLMIVAIDDFSLQQAVNADLSSDPLLQSLSQWLWPRRIHATVLDRLIEAGASAVGFDLLFESPSSHGDEDDAAFAEALQRHREQVPLELNQHPHSFSESFSTSSESPTTETAFFPCKSNSENVCRASSC